MTKSYIDPVKAQARVKLKDFIERNLFQYKRPGDIRVVCFPGAEVPGEEAIEVREVYDGLGIPRQNITGLELDCRKAERLKQANLGIEVVCQDAHEYFLETPKKFDVISLDYTGPQTTDKTDTLAYIASKHILSRQGILSTVYLGQRESRHLQFVLARRALYFSRNPDASNFSSEEDYYNEIKKVMEGSLDFSRESITQAIISIFLRGSFNPPNSSHLFKNSPNREKVLEAARKMTESKIESDKEFLGLESKIAEELGVYPSLLRNQNRPTAVFWELERRYFSMKVDKLIESLAKGILMMQSEMPSTYLSEYAKISPSESQYAAILLSEFMNFALTQPYYPLNIERYCYVSNKGSRMLMDMIRLSQISKAALNSVGDLVTYDPSEQRLKLNPLGLDFPQWWKRIENLKKVRDKVYSYEWGPRADLSSQVEGDKLADIVDDNNGNNSQYNAKLKEVISKADAADLLMSGCSPREIAECFSGFTVPQLAAIKANITRGNKIKV